MKVIKGNIWEYWKKGFNIVIPTNGYIKRDGSCVMGKGLAFQAKGYVYGIEYKVFSNDLKVIINCL